MLDGGCQVTWTVRLGPHSNNIPIFNSRRTNIQACPWQWSPACGSLEETEPSAARGCKFCHSAQCSLSGRMAADNETLFTAKGNGNFKGVAHMLLIGGMITGKENWIERQRTRILFPELPLRHCVNAVPPWSGMPLGHSEVVPGRGIRSKKAQWLTGFLVESTEGHRALLHWQHNFRDSPLATGPIGCASSSPPPTLLRGYSWLPVGTKPGPSVQRDQKTCPDLSIPGAEMNPLTPGRDLWPQVTWDWGS